MKRAAIMISALLVLAAALPAFGEGAGQFTEMQGQVSIQRARGGSDRAVLGTQVFQGDVVTTARDSKATILFNDGSVMRLGPSTTLEINKLVYEEDEGIASYVYNVASGTVMSVVSSLFGSDDSNYEVKTPTAVSGVRGTMFIVKVGVDPQTGQLTTTLVGVDGNVNFEGSDGNGVNVGGGQFSNAPAGGGAGTPSPVDDALLQSLLDSVNVDFSSLDQRALGLRRQGGQNPGGLGGFVPPQIGPDINPDDLSSNNDNPSDIIYQEPPQFTELILTVDIGGGG